MRVVKTTDYAAWLDQLKDLSGRARILMRVDRLVHGNPGDHRHLTDGVVEMRIDVGPGYRVYYAERGGHLVLLLVGGDKSTQQQDIARAIRMAKAHRES